MASRKGTRKVFSPEEKAAYREQKRAEQRERLEQAVSDLASSEGWKRWVESRAMFHRYSFGNTLLIASQRPDATIVASYKTWQRAGRQVRKGERGIVINVPMPVKLRSKGERDAMAEQLRQSRKGLAARPGSLEAGELGESDTRIVFKAGYVFDTLSRESPGRAERRRRAFGGRRARRGDGCWVAGATRRVAEVAQHPSARPTAGRRGALVGPPGSAAWSTGIKGSSAAVVIRQSRLPNESGREPAGGSGTSCSSIAAAKGCAGRRFLQGDCGSARATAPHADASVELHGKERSAKWPDRRNSTLCPCHVWSIVASNSGVAMACSDPCRERSLAADRRFRRSRFGPERQAALAPGRSLALDGG
jgi:hypothetical protein